MKEKGKQKRKKLVKNIQSHLKEDVRYFKDDIKEHGGMMKKLSKLKKGCPRGK